jgi:simple sugar transport system substrate-binding protein
MRRRATRPELAAALVAGALFAAPAGAGAAAPAKLRVIIVTHGQAGDPYWNAVKKGSGEGARDFGADVQYEAPEVFDMSAMAKLIDAAVAARPDGLAVSIPDADALGPAIRSAVAAGIPVIAIDAGRSVYQALGVSAYLGQDEYQAGLAVGRRLQEGGASHILCIHQEVGNVDLDNRCRGVKDGSGAELTVLPVPTDPNEVRSRVAGALQRSRKLDAMIALGPLGAIPMLRAVDETDSRSRLKVMATFDLTPEVLERVADGTLAFATDAQQFLMGYLPVALFRLHQLYGVMPTEVWPTGPRFITRAEAARVMELSRKGYR